MKAFILFLLLSAIALCDFQIKRKCETSNIADETQNVFECRHLFESVMNTDANGKIQQMSFQNSRGCIISEPPGLKWKEGQNLVEVGNFEKSDSGYSTFIQQDDKTQIRVNFDYAKC